LSQTNIYTGKIAICFTRPQKLFQKTMGNIKFEFYVASYIGFVHNSDLDRVPDICALKDEQMQQFHQAGSCLAGIVTRDI